MLSIFLYRCPKKLEMDRYIGWPKFLADTDISVSVLIISVSARTISVFNPRIEGLHELDEVG